MNKTIDAIEKRLRQSFLPRQIEVLDESHLHIGHAGSQSGKGHYALTISSEAFAGKSPIERHRMIYQALDELMQSKIHALSIKAKTP